MRWDVIKLRHAVGSGNSIAALARPWLRRLSAPHATLAVPLRYWNLSFERSCQLGVQSIPIANITPTVPAQMDWTT
jgi:hypothetical protein